MELLNLFVSLLRLPSKTMAKSGEDKEFTLNCFGVLKLMCSILVSEKVTHSELWRLLHTDCNSCTRKEKHVRLFYD